MLIETKNKGSKEEFEPVQNETDELTKRDYDNLLYWHGSFIRDIHTSAATNSDKLTHQKIMKIRNAYINEST